MDELKNKFEELLRENKNLKEENQQLKNDYCYLKEEFSASSFEHENKIKILEQENKSLLKHYEEVVEKLKATENSTDDFESLKDYIIKYRNYIAGILGYKVNIIDDEIILNSLYSFDSEDVLIFKIRDDKLELVNNDFAIGFKNEIQSYLVNTNGIPAFLSSVTMYLYNQKTFG